ncbi:cytochrome P450 4c3 isoform X1 [Rhipicephalus sanguineus]|uniref:cytochrome P450 4c3 isoform X1 n=1 Tax=Rhipicephalus sanguineus TaxID=34632 RepID=UPI001895B115|nr:cytochrome P450 4c3 isoform X1 [Rhipicephalus sanguineus]XP_037518316.1 cytochrome P450 4c3 isoform X1 [Rhipicephalus sanguineus]
MSSSAAYYSSGFLDSNGVAGAASFFAVVLALCICVVVSVVLAFLLTVKFIQLRKLRSIKSVPHRREPLPYMNLLSLLKSCSQGGPTWLSATLFAATVGFHHVHKKRGMYMFFVGTRPSVSLQRAEFVEEALSSNSLLAKGPEYTLLHNWLGTGLLTGTGNKWRTRRRMFTPAFHFRILEDFISTINAQSTVLADKLGKMCSPGKRTDIVPLVTMCTLDIICETIMGTSIRAQHDERSPYVKAVNRLGELFILRMLNPFLQSEYVFKRSSIGKEYYECLNTLHTFTRKVIAERKELLQNQHRLEDQSDSDSDIGKQKRKRPFLDLLITEHLKDSASINEEDIREEVDTFMFEGHDTTAMGISWALFLIGHQPVEQQKIHDELDAIFGSDKHRPVTSEDLREMKYLECCIKEAQRLYPSVSFLTRTCEQPFEIGSVTFPAGTVVRVSVYCLHRDEDVFPKPEEFHPERFFPENAKGRHPFAYIPFSAGPRNCIGQKFALSEEKIVIANILRRFKLKSLDQRDQINLVAELVLRPKSGLRIQFTAR